MHASLFIVEDTPAVVLCAGKAQPQEGGKSCILHVCCCRPTDGIGIGPVILHKIGFKLSTSMLFNLGLGLN